MRACSVTVIASSEAPGAGVPSGLMTTTDPFDDAARRRLTAERERVQGLIESVHGDGIDESAADEVGDLAHVSDPADQGSETFEREKDLAILEQLEGDLAEIEAALQRLDEGTYGIDEVTGRPIARERLEAFPTARTNVDTHT
jgi:RNA polymerase-binding transcription factor DksA